MFSNEDFKQASETIRERFPLSKQELESIINNPKFITKKEIILREIEDKVLKSLAKELEKL